jgi:hypothetical protein
MRSEVDESGRCGRLRCWVNIEPAYRSLRWPVNPLSRSSISLTPPSIAGRPHASPSTAGTLPSLPVEVTAVYQHRSVADWERSSTYKAFSEMNRCWLPENGPRDSSALWWITWEWAALRIRKNFTSGWLHPSWCIDISFHVRPRCSCCRLCNVGKLIVRECSSILTNFDR